MVRRRQLTSDRATRAVNDDNPDSQTLNHDEHDNELENTIRILIASDNHIGFAERDPVRGNDSYDSFREVMEIAKAQDVDMVLLAGDLFHENKPSRKSMFQAMRSLRLNCLGDKPCELEVLGDQSVATEDVAVMHINYENPDINVAIPVFSIHGNHDDPSGEGRLCALDILQVSGLLNYYGRVPESDDITVKPVLLQKGTTKLALYGLSNVRDERLHRSFRHNKVRFMRPELYQDEWFNLIAVHQNHHAYTSTNYLPENFIQNFFDFVVWGHEHECKIDPILNPEQEFHVCQPGSSVVTSLSPGEALPKHVGVLSIKDRDWKMRKIPLKSVRPFVMKEFSLSDYEELDPKEKNKADVIAFLMEKVEQAIVEAQEQWLETRTESDDDTQPPLPLIRIRVDYSSAVGAYELENPQRFSQRFLGRVANPNDVAQFHMKKKPATRKSKTEAVTSDKPDLSDVGLSSLRVSALVKQFLEKQTLQCLPENELGDAVMQFVEKDDRDAVKDFVADHLKSQVDIMTANKTTESNLSAAIERNKITIAEQFEARQERLNQQRQRREHAQVSEFESGDETVTQRARSPVRARKAPAPRKLTTTAPKRKVATKRRQKPASEDEEEDEKSGDDGSVRPEIEDEIEELAAKKRQTRATKAAPKAPARQAKLNFTSTPAAKVEQLTQQQSISISSDDEEDVFMPVSSKRTR